MRDCHAYDYAILRLVPQVEREEFLNVGVILSCPDRQFLGVRVHVDHARALEQRYSATLCPPSMVITAPVI